MKSGNIFNDNRFHRIQLKVGKNCSQAAVDGQQNGYHSEKDEFGIVEKMGNRRRRRWLNDK